MPLTVVSSAMAWIGKQANISTRAFIIVLLLTFALLPAVAFADSYVGGQPLATVQSGTVSGDLWFDATPPVFATSVTKDFMLPADAVAVPGRIVWARLYVSTYNGHMQDQRHGTITTQWDGDGVAGYEQSWTEDLNVPFVYVVNGGNDNRAFPGHGAAEPYKLVNDHCNRVTSDYFMWYDVASLISSRNVRVAASASAVGSSFDGRIKEVALVVAYNDGDADQVRYWVNQGHDVCSYYTEDNFDEVAMGTTTFATSGLSGVTSATLTSIYMASNNGYYGFPTAKNNFVASTKAGGFTNVNLDRTPDVQGAYSGVRSWDVISSISAASYVTLGYARYLPGTGTAGFFKMPLALLKARIPGVSTPVAAFSGSPTSGTAPLTVAFSDASTGATAWQWDFDGDGVIDSTASSPSYTYSTPGIYPVTLTVSGPGGTNSHSVPGYIRVTSPGSPGSLSVSGIILANSSAPVAGFAANRTTGSIPLAVHFTDQSTGATAWQWDFDGDGVIDSTDQHPSYTYNSSGVYTVRLTVAGAAGSNSTTKSGYITVTETPVCDLNISGAVNTVGQVAFARMSNRVYVYNIRNIGSSSSLPTEVEVRSGDGFVARVALPALAGGEMTTVSVLDPTIRQQGSAAVTYTATIDPDNLVAETNESNNVKASSAKAVVNNGYAGKRYSSGGSDVGTVRVYDLHGGLLYSAGDSAYRSGSFGASGWNSYTVSWPAGDFPLSANATVRAALLYVPYTWDNSNQAPDHVSISFNGQMVARSQWYSDASNFGAYYDHVYGLLVYDVTSLYRKGAPNTALFTREDANAKISPYGFTLAVVYEDAAATRKQIFLNEEFDLLGADPAGYGTSTETASAYVPFTGLQIDVANVSQARLITFVPSGNGEGNLYFNGHHLGTNVWDYGVSSGTQVAVDSREVRPYLRAGDNVARIQSTEDSTPCMAAAQQFLVVEYTPAGITTANATNLTTSAQNNSTSGTPAGPLLTATPSPAPAGNTTAEMISGGDTDKTTSRISPASWPLILSLLLLLSGASLAGVYYGTRGLPAAVRSQVRIVGDRSLPLWVIMLLLVAVVLIGMAGAFTLLQSGAPVERAVAGTHDVSFEALPVVQAVEDLVPANGAPDYPDGFSADNGVLFHMSGSDPVTLEDLIIRLECGDSSINLGSRAAMPASRCTSPAVQAYLQIPGSDGRTVRPGDWLMLYADNCLELAGGKALSWSPDGPSLPFVVSFGEECRYAIIYEPDGTILAGGTVQFGP
ncbi:MAG: PKD domain protein [Methanocella sp. PtaU1.Bin125]|nr:MAG: PKD domain protein [Methanocella sp. PtaU1.Bin125]